VRDRGHCLHLPPTTACTTAARCPPPGRSARPPYSCARVHGRGVIRTHGVVLGIQQALEYILQHLRPQASCVICLVKLGAAPVYCHKSRLRCWLKRVRPPAEIRSTNPEVRRGVRSVSAEPRSPRDCRECRAGRGQHLARSRRISSRGLAQSYWGNRKGMPWDLSPARAPRTVSARLLRSLHRQHQTRTRGRASTPRTLSHQGCIVGP
jgi:hypothetical protein